MKEKQIDSLLENIDTNLNNAKDIISTFQHLSPSEKESNLQNLDQLKQQINSDILMFETMLNSSKRKKILINTKDDIAERQMMFENELESLKKSHYKIEEPPAQEAMQSDNAVLVDLGDHIGQEAIDKGEEVVEKLKNANKMLLDIEDEIYEQRLKLLRIKDNIKTSQSLMNRGKEVVNYFAKAMARDKFIRVAILLMAILMVGIFALMFLFNKSQKKQQAVSEKNEIKKYEKEGISLENGKVKLDKDAKKNETDYLLVMEAKAMNQAKEQFNIKNQKKHDTDKNNKAKDASKDVNDKNFNENGKKKGENTHKDKDKQIDKDINANADISNNDKKELKLDKGVDDNKKMKKTRERRVLDDIEKGVNNNKYDAINNYD